MDRTAKFERVGFWRGAAVALIDGLLLLLLLPFLPLFWRIQIGVFERRNPWLPLLPGLLLTTPPAGNAAESADPT